MAGTPPLPLPVVHEEASGGVPACVDDTWHHAGTGGLRTWLGIDRAARTGTVILLATSVPVDCPSMITGV